MELRLAPIGARRRNAHCEAHLVAEKDGLGRVGGRYREVERLHAAADKHRGDLDAVSAELAGDRLDTGVSVVDAVAEDDYRGNLLCRHLLDRKFERLGYVGDRAEVLLLCVDRLLLADRLVAQEPISEPEDVDLVLAGGTLQEAVVATGGEEASDHLRARHPAVRELVELEGGDDVLLLRIRKERVIKVHRRGIVDKHEDSLLYGAFTLANDNRLHQDKKRDRHGRHSARDEDLRRPRRNTCAFVAVEGAHGLDCESTEDCREEQRPGRRQEHHASERLKDKPARDRPERHAQEPPVPYVELVRSEALHRQMAGDPRRDAKDGEQRYYPQRHRLGEQIRAYYVLIHDPSVSIMSPVRLFIAIQRAIAGSATRKRNATNARTRQTSLPKL